MLDAWIGWGSRGDRRRSVRRLGAMLDDAETIGDSCNAYQVLFVAII